MKELWTPWIKPWSPNGPEDPELALLRMSIDAAEYRESRSGPGSQLYGMANAVTKGTTDVLNIRAKVTTPCRPKA